MINKSPRTLEVLEAGSAGLVARVDPGIIGIAMAPACIDLRAAVGEGREGRPALAACCAGFASRPSMRATAVPG